MAGLAFPNSSWEALPTKSFQRRTVRCSLSAESDLRIMADRYSLQSFIRDMDRIILEESSPAKIVAEAKFLLAKLLRQPDCIEPKFKKRGATAYGRYMLHRAPQFNVTAVVWGPGDNAKAHNHDTWGLVGVVQNEIQETRFRRRDDGSKPDYADLEVTAVL